MWINMKNAIQLDEKKQDKLKQFTDLKSSAIWGWFIFQIIIKMTSRREVVIKFIQIFG